MMARSVPKEDKVIDVEAESSALMQRSAELASLWPAPSRSSTARPSGRRRGGGSSRQNGPSCPVYVAIQLAAGLDAGVGVVVGRPPPIRRVGRTPGA